MVKRFFIFIRKRIYKEAGIISERLTPATVAVVRCDSYDVMAVEDAVKKGIDLLGGVKRFAHAAETILFKPNVLWGTDPAKCVVTHPVVLRAAVKAFMDTSAELVYGDSCAGLSKTVSAMEKCGYPALLKSLRVSVASFDRGHDVEFPDGTVSKRLKIADAVIDADAVINLPKLKSHGLVRMTGAVKNCFGCIPRLEKGQQHARFPDVFAFSRFLADVAAFVKPRLHIMDAIVAMEGNGPQSGTPKKLGVLLFSNDPVALDTVACRLINLAPEYVPTIAAGVRRGLGVSDASLITMIGDTVEEVVDRSFKVVRKPPEKIVTTTLLGNIRKYFLTSRPVIMTKKCSKCGRCVSVCPLLPRAIEKKSDRSVPRYNYRLCIRCYCCHEVCPSEAIVIRKTVLGQLLPPVAYISLFIANKIVRRRNKA